jgi:hypothetical protein
MTLLTDSEIEAIERTAGKEWSEATTFFPSIATRAIRKAEAAILARMVPVGWIPDWSYGLLLGSETHPRESHALMMYADPQHKTGLVPLYALPGKGDEARDAEIAALRATLRKLLELAGADADDIEWIKAWAVARSLIDAQRKL